MRTDEEFKNEVLKRAAEYSRKRAARIKACTLALAATVICAGAAAVIVNSGQIETDKATGAQMETEDLVGDSETVKVFSYVCITTDGIVNGSDDYEYVNKLDDAFKEALQTGASTQVSPSKAASPTTDVFASAGVTQSPETTADMECSITTDSKEYTVEIQKGDEKTTYYFDGKTVQIQGGEKTEISKECAKKILALLDE